ncbi:MAG: glycine cleavage system aminomethyltransferase GcvT [bacterium]|nr:glycine cleavage system aminomethyltransferase GcvT [bacterium]
MKKTYLYDWHVAHGAKMVEFGGYLMPVSYEGVLAEHEAVRSACGLFDISHMGEIYISGQGALNYVQQLTSNDASQLKEHEAQYSLLMHSDGYAIDDILVYRLEDGVFLLCVNAGNAQRDWEWIESHVPEGVRVRNATESTGMIALQGPRSVELLSRLKIDLLALKKFSTLRVKIENTECLLSRTGYTGEEGCEFFLPAEHSQDLWETLLKNGADLGCVPVGLGARDTLRLEMGYVLYGHELNEQINPLEAGLSWVVKFSKRDFFGKEALLQVKEEGLKRKITGVLMEERGIPREGMALIQGTEKIGELVSGTLSPSLHRVVGTALVDLPFLEQPGQIFVDIRGKMKKAKFTKPPFIQRT